MAAYDITAPDGKTYRLDGPAGASKIDLINALAAKYPMAVQTTEELEAAPRAPSSAGNLFKGLSSAVLGGTKSLVDVTGAGTGISKSLGEASQFLESKMTPERQEEMQRRQELIDRANRSGSLLKEAKAYLGGVFEAPLESTVRGIGSSAPSIIAGLAALPLEAPAALALGVSAISRIAVGAAQGVGEYKGGVFDTVKAKYMEAGYKEPEAERLAIKAQEYSADKALELGGSALLGALDAYTGIEAAATGAFRKVPKPNTPEGLAQAYKGLPKTAPPLASPNILGSAARSVAGEAPIEGLQGGFGQFAQNLAVSKEGFEQAPFEGVLGSSLRDAAVGALVGGTFTPLNHAQRSRDFALDQYLRTQGPIAVAEQERAARRKEIEDANALTKEQLGIKEPPLMLEGPKDKLFKPDEEILRDPVGRITRNELGNALQDKEVADKVTGYIDSYRSKNNLPPLQTFSLEDIKDAMTSEAPAGELGALQSILTYKTGFNNETVSADDVLNAAEAKEIATGTQGFKDFLERATGSSDLDTMSDVQRFSAFKALSSLNKRETGRETVLRPGTNASRFTQDQFDEGLTTLAQYINQENGKLAMPEAIEIIKAQTSLKTDRDAYTLLNNAAAQNLLNFDKGEVFNVVDRNGDITSTHATEEKAKEFAGKKDTIEKQAGEFVSIAEEPKAKAPLPKGYAVTKQTVEGEVTPAGYQISDAEGKPFPTLVEQVEDLKAKVEQMEGVRRSEADKELTGALRIQQALQQRSDNITKMEALGQTDTIGYKKLKNQQLIAEREFSKRIQSLLDRAERLKAPLKTKPVGRNVQPKDVYTLTKDGKTVGKFKNEDEAYASMFLTPETEGGLSDKELEDIAVKGGNLGDRAFKAIEARQTKGFKVETTPEVRAKAEFQAKADEIAKNLLPMLKRFGLEDVGLKIVSAIENGAEGSYLNSLIEIAVAAGKQVETLRHESLHALKDLGFFTDAQWKSLERQADSVWINKYLRGKKYGDTGMTRYDAYYDMFEKKGYNPAQITEAIREEAIADAFADFSRNKPPAGMIASLLARLNNFFTALRNALNGAGFNTADDIFEKIEAGELKSTRASQRAGKQLSLGAGRTIPLSTVDLMEMDERSSREELGLKTKKNEGERAGQLNNVREIAIALNKQTIDLFGKMDKGTLTAADVNKLAEAMADEVIYQLGTLDETGTGQGWYSNNYPNAVKMLAKKFEELESNKHARSVFTALVAITSNGEKVNKNIDNAIKLYSKIRLGQPLVAMGNRRATALQNNLVTLQELLAEHGENFEQHLLKETTVKDMNIELRARGESPDGSYLAETTVPTAAIYFGPKLGAFYANLSGSEGYLTMDLWWTRTINRMRGLLIPKATASSIGKFRTMMDRPDATREEVIAAAAPLRDKYFDYGYNTELEHLIGSKEPTKKFKKEAWFKRAQKAAGDSYEQLLYEHNLEKMANTIYKAEYDMLEEKPFSATDRKFMYDAARKTQSLLRERGVRLTLADIQASLWYYEKRLYQKLSGRKADDIGYEEAIIAKADESTGRARPSVVFTGGPNGGSVATGAIQGSEQVREEPPAKDAKLSLKGVIAEVAPHPEREIAGKWREMTPSERLAATTNVANKIMRQVFDELNLKGYTYKFSTGRYEGEQNPNIIVEAPDNASTQDLNKLARFMGYVFDQKAMVAFDETNTTSGDQAGFVKVIVPDGMSPDDLNRLRNLIGSTVPQAEGDTLRDGALLFGNFSAYNDSIETLDNNQFAQALVNAVESFDYDGVIRVSEPETFHSELIWPDNREAYLEGTEYGKSGNIQGEEGRDVRREGRGVIQAIADEAISLRDKWIDARGAARIGSGTKFDEVGVPEPSAEYGEPQEGSVSAVGVHFSKQARPLLVSAMYGTGLRGAENARLSDATDIRPRIYFYVDKGNGIRPEAGVGGVAHVIQLNNLYNATEDKDGIVKNNRGKTVHEAGNNLERSIVKAGYDGYLSLDPLLAQGFAVLLGKHNIETNVGGTKLEGKKYSLGTYFPTAKAAEDAAYAKGPPQTHEFKVFFGASKAMEEGRAQPMFHASTEEFDIFRENKPIFVSPEARFAEDFIKRRIEEAKSLEYLSEGKERVARIYPLWVRAETPFDYENADHVRMVMEYLYPKLPIADTSIEKEVKDGLWSRIEEPKFQAALKALGFDSFQIKEDNIKQLAVFKANQVKSITGNIGEFNPENKSIKYSLGSVAYSPERLNNLVGEFSYLQNGAEKSTKGYIGRVNPMDFVDATATPAEKARVEKELKPLDLQKLSILPKEMRLTVRKDGDNWEIINHDGRHRMLAFHNAGYTSVPVVIETPRINDAEPIDGKSLRGQSSAILSSVYISDLQPLSYDNKEKVAEVYSIPKPVKYSLPTISAAAQKRVNEATTVTEPKTRFESITEAVFPRSFSYFRQEAINRYNQLSVYDKTLADQMGGKDLLASVSAEQGALFSDLDSGVLASVMGVGNRQGGMPVYRNGITTVDTSVKGLTEVFAPLAKFRDPVVFQHYQFWAAVKRGLRLIEIDKERNIQTSDKIIADELEAKYPEFVQVQKDWITFNNGVVKYLVDTNVLSQERANEYMKYADYIPFYRQLDGRETLGPKVFQSLTTVKPPREIHGSDNPLADFLETVVRNTHASIRAGMKNSAALKAVDVATQVKAAGMGAEMVVDAKGEPMESNSPDTFTVFKAGKKVSYRTPDALLISALTSLNMPELPFMGLISAPANALRNLVTKDPGFMMVNLMRDSLSAYVTSGVNILPIAGSAHQFVKGLMKQSPTMEALLNAGIGGGYEFSQNIERSGANLYADLQKKAGNAPKGLIGLATGVWDALETGTTASDMATRALIYERVMKETGDEAEALKRALEVMNFNRKGRSAVVRILTAAVPFLNARIQGLDVFFRAGVSPTYRSLRGLPVTDQEKAVMRRFWIRGSTMMALSVMYYFAVSDDDEYKKQEQETKDNYWIVPSTSIKIATPFEVGTLFKTIPERLAAYLSGKDTGEDFAKAMYRAFNNTIPISPTAYIPQVFKPLLEYSTNFNFFTMRPIVGQGMEGIDAKYQVGPSTSLTFQELGKTLGVSPLKAEQMYKGYTGTMGMYLVDLMDAVMEASGSNPQATKRFEQLPIIKRFALDPQARGDVTAYYELRNSVHTAVATANMLERSDPKEFVEYFKENRGLLANKDYVNDLYKTLKQFNDMRRMVNTSTMSGDEKRAALTNINFAEQNLTKNIQVVKKAIASIR